MSDDDIIRKAVELAGWKTGEDWGVNLSGGISNQKALDALAAQLKSQFSDGSYAERLTDGGWQFQFIPYNTCERSDWFEAETESMAAIRAIVESVVLDEG